MGLLRITDPIFKKAWIFFTVLNPCSDSFLCISSIYSMVNLFHPWKLCHPLTLSMQKKPPNIPQLIWLPRLLPSQKKQKNLLHLLCTHATSHRTKAIPSLATAAPKANGGAIQGTVGRPTARQPIRGHREHRRVQPATQQVVRGNARLAGRWVGPLLDIAKREAQMEWKYITPTNGREYHG